MGEHRGLAFYTIGQRKGLGLNSQTALYVLAKDPQNNALIVGEAEELGSRELYGRQVNWISGSPPAGSLRAGVKVRYKAADAAGTITPLDEGRVHVVFDQPVRDITPGQGVVFYQGDICLGSGIIAA